jgi:opacity protein-like surface antigen
MIRSIVRVCLLSVVVMAWVQPASAQWYVSPYVGKVFKLTHPFGESTVGAASDSPTAIGVSGGTSPFKRVGLEIDFQRVNNVFRTGDSQPNEFGEAFVGPNSMQSVTAGAHFGHTIAGRIRPYGVVGGGFNYINLGTEHFTNIDFDFISSRTPAQQTVIFNCLTNTINAPPQQQSTACGVPLVTDVGDEEKGYKGLVTVGGGVNVKVASHVAARVDIRFFKSVPDEDEGPFTFWRFVVGVVIHR